MRISFGGAYLLKFKNKEISDNMYELYKRRIQEENVKNHCCCRPDTSKISPEVVKYNDTQLLILTGKDKQESDEIFELSDDDKCPQQRDNISINCSLLEKKIYDAYAQKALKLDFSAYDAKQIYCNNDCTHCTY